MVNDLPDASKIKLITVDLDGTLLNTRRRISDRTSIVVRKVLDKYPHLHFVLASGRAKPATELIRERLGIVRRPRTESLLCNGCLVYDSEGQILWQNTLPQEFLLGVHQILCEGKSLPDHVVIYSTGDDTVLFDGAWETFAREKCQERPRVEDLQKYTQTILSGKAQINKISFMVFEPSHVEDIMFKLAPLAQKHHIQCSRSNITFLEYMPPETNKGSGLAQLMKQLKIGKEEVLAFGDGGNDLELLDQAGWPVAMANACESLKPHARLTAKSNAEDGVADMLERIFLKEELLN